MRGVFHILAAVAAVSILPAPASAERHGAQFSAGHGGQFSSRGSSGHGPSGVRIHRGHHGDRHDRGRFDGLASADRDHNRRFRGDTFFPYRDYQGDSLWRSDSFNDWWHDRPDRAFPRWVANNQDCQRRYWAGGDWRC